MTRATWRAPSTTWALKGIGEETRELVREAAAQADQLLGDWVDRALLRAAREALDPPPPPATKHDVATILGALSQLKATPRAAAGLEALQAELADLKVLLGEPHRPEAGRSAELAPVLRELAELRASVVALTRLVEQQRSPVRPLTVEHKPRRSLHKRPAEGGDGNNG